ncbi:MAG: hypothetical protein AMXMBFR33_12330 [Candidatus Xenobia bacterium]
MRKLKSLLDAGLAATVLGPALVLGALRCQVRKTAPRGRGRRLLVLDMSYTLKAIRERKLLTPVLARDLDGFFEKVWSVHPLGPAEEASVIEESVLSERHVFIQGTVGGGALPWTRFALEQVRLFHKLERLIRDERISLIRVGDPYYLGLLGLSLSRLTGVPLAMRLAANHDRLYRDTGRPVMPRLFKWRWVEKLVEWIVFPRTDLVAALNQENLDYALWSGARRERATIFRLGNLIHPDHFLPPKQRPKGVLADLPGEGPILASVARLEPVKMPEHIVLLLGALRERGIRARGLVVGDGTMRGEIQELARRLQVESQLIMVGNRDQEWLARALPECEVVVSFVTGRALTEAALAGAAVVSYDLDWQRELIVSGRTGELVPAGDVEAMAAAVAGFLQDPERARACGQRLRELALSMMEPERLSEHERATYRKLLEGQDASAGSGEGGEG